MQTFLKAATGAISAPFKVLRRNMGQEEAFIRNPKEGGEERGFISKELLSLLIKRRQNFLFQNS